MSGPASQITSGVTRYSQVATEIITAAFQIMGTINEDETPSAGMFKTGMRSLNSMVKEWETSGIHIWTEREAILFLQQGQVRYLLGNDSTDHCADAYSYKLTTLQFAVAAAAVSVTVVDPTGMVVGDKFGFVLDTGAAFWTTVKTIAGQVIGLNAPAPSSATDGNFVFDYTTDIVRPLRVPSSRRLQYQGLIETPMGYAPGQMLSRQEYMDLTNKNSPGTVTSAYYNPARIQGEFFVWPQPTNATNGVRFTYYRPIESFVSVDDEPDLPDEWTNCLDWNLAKELMPMYSVPAERFDRIKVTAAEKLEMVQGWDREPQSIYFGRAYGAGR